MEGGNDQQGGPERAPQTNDHPDPVAADIDELIYRVLGVKPRQFVSAGVRCGDEEEIPDPLRAMAERRRLASTSVAYQVAELPPGYLEQNKVGLRMMEAMGYKLGMMPMVERGGVRVALPYSAATMESE